MIEKGMIFIQEKKRSGFFKGLWSKKEEVQHKEKEENVQNPSVEKEQENIQQPKQEEQTINVPQSLYSLYKIWCHDSKEILRENEFQEWVLNPILQMKKEETQITQILQEVGKNAEEILAKIQAQEAQELEENTEEEEKKEIIKKPIDATGKITVTKDAMAAFLFCFPPFYEGKKIDQDFLNHTIQKEGVVYGIDKPLLETIAEKQFYFQIFLFAKGTLPVHGKDGEIIDHIPRTTKVDIKENTQGIVDFRDLNLFRNIHKDEVICDIVHATEGIDGHDVRGKILSAKKGKEPRIPSGRHTILTKDKTQLISELDGHIIFDHDKYRVEDRLVIENNVDNSTGNLNFLGDIIIHGDVLNGFEVTAVGDIYIKGMVEGAKITAGGNIEIGKGMNGNRQGVLNAKGNVKCTFLEHSTVYAGGNVHAESIVWCNVFCDDTVKVRYGKGVIIGGSITATHLIDAKIIGSKANRETELALGIMPHVLTEKKEVEKELKNTIDILDKLDKNIMYLKSLPTLPKGKAVILEELIRQKDLYSVSRIELQEKQGELEAKANNSESSRIVCDTMYPPTKISIENSVLIVTYTAYKCNVYLSSQKEVTMGTI